jgi:hypothetical protein
VVRQTVLADHPYRGRGDVRVDAVELQAAEVLAGGELDHRPGSRVSRVIQSVHD